LSLPTGAQVSEWCDRLGRQNGRQDEHFKWEIVNFALKKCKVLRRKENSENNCCFLEVRKFC
jgi:hypothetical protein